MQLKNKVILSVAGSGKTTNIVRKALENPFERSIILTYTIDNYKSIKEKLIKMAKVIPSNIEVSTYYSFLLANGIRPYQNSVYAGPRIKNIYFENIPITKRKIPERNTNYYYFHSAGLIYRDKMAQFVCKCNKATEGGVIQRLEEIYNHIYIDEVQDMAGYDLDFLYLLMRSKIKVTCVGDHRQATYSTNNSLKNKQYKGNKIIKLFHKWHKEKLCSIEHNLICYRCVQDICDFSNLLFPEDELMVSRNRKSTSHDGVFFINTKDIEKYIQMYYPQILRYNKSSKIEGINFGKSKGLEFERVLIKPTKKIETYFKTGNIKEIGDIDKFYVAVTRARQSVTFIYNGEMNIDIIKKYDKWA